MPTSGSAQPGPNGSVTYLTNTISKLNPVQQIEQTVINGTVTAGVQTVVNGGNFGKNLVGDLETAAVYTVGAAACSSQYDTGT